MRQLEDLTPLLFEQVGAVERPVALGDLGDNAARGDAKALGILPQDPASFDVGILQF